MNSCKNDNPDSSPNGQKPKKKSVRLTKRKKTEKLHHREKIVNHKPLESPSVNENLPVKQGDNREIEHKWGHHPNSKKNQFQSGQSGNPKGRPPGQNILSTDMRECLTEMASKFKWVAKLAEGLGLDPDEVTFSKVFGLNTLRQAMMSKGATFTQEVFNRIEGKVADQTNDEGVEEKARLLREFLESAEKFGGPSAPESGES